MERPSIRAYPPAQVIAEKFQTMVALGLANGRMKDFYDLWAIPKAMPIDDQALHTAIAATFARRTTPIPQERPSGLSYRKSVVLGKTVSVRVDLGVSRIIKTRQQNKQT